MTPKSDNAVRRPDLQAYVWEFFKGEDMTENGDMLGMIANKVMPVFPVDEEAATYDVIPKEEWLKIPDVKRAADGSYNRTRWQFETGTYVTEDKGLEEKNDDVNASKFDRRNGEGSSEFLVMDRGMSKLMLAREQEVANMVFNTTNFSVNNLTNEWDDFTNATPIQDIVTAKKAVRKVCGKIPNTLIVNYDVFENLKLCDEIIDRLKYDFGSQNINFMKLNADQLAQALGVKQVLIAGALYDSAAGGQDASIAELWDDEYAMLTVVDDSTDITKLSIGRTFLWTADSEQLPIVEQYREESVRADIFRVRYYGQPNLIASRDSSGTIKSNVSAGCSYLFGNVTS